LIGEEVYRAAYYRTLVRRVTQSIPVEGALLEIGSGAGGLLAEFKRRGWQVEGIEPSPQLYNHAKTVLSGEVPLHPCEMAEAGPCLQMRPYKAIIAVDVIEHLPDPFLLSRTAVEWLVPGGCLILQTPNAHSLRRFLQGGGWEQLAPSEHFFLHTAKSLAALLKNAQFEGIHIRTVSGGATDGFWRGLLMKPVGAGLNLLGLGSALWAVARKGMP
jgi:2-polyprenyl-3-methyl-5-hydroxy-6-metoxy-1,4-benzoquinol methylase